MGLSTTLLQHEPEQATPLNTQSPIISSNSAEIAISSSASDHFSPSSQSNLEKTASKEEKGSWLQGMGKFAGSIAINSGVGISGAVTGGIIGTLFFPPFGTIIGTAIGGALGGGIGDYASQRIVDEKSNDEIQWGFVIGSGVVGGLTGGASSLVAVAKNLVKLGAKEAGEQILTSSLGKVAQFIAPTSELSIKGFQARAVANGSMGVITGLSTYTFDKEAKATDIIAHILGSVLLGEAVHISVKGLSFINLNKSLMNGVSKIDEKIASLKPNEKINIFADNTGNIILKQPSEEASGLQLLAEVYRNQDYTLNIETSTLADEIKNNYNVLLNQTKLKDGILNNLPDLFQPEKAKIPADLSSQTSSKIKVLDLPSSESNTNVEILQKVEKLKINFNSQGSFKAKPLDLQGEYSKSNMVIGDNTFIANYNTHNLTYLNTINNEPSIQKTLKLLDPNNEIVLSIGKDGGGYMPTTLQMYPAFYSEKILVGPALKLEGQRLPLLNVIEKNLGISLDLPENTLQKLINIFSLVHEYGHSKDINLKKPLASYVDRVKRIKLQSQFDSKLSYDENLLKINEAYRELPSETFADNYAIEFLKKHGYEIFADEPDLQKFFFKE